MFQNIIEVIILSAIQGVSEFLPISSSAHLILVSSLYEFKSSSLLIDISLHLGSLFAIIYFFRNDLLDVKTNKKLLGTCLCVHLCVYYALQWFSMYVIQRARRALSLSLSLSLSFRVKYIKILLCVYNTRGAL